MEMEMFNVLMGKLDDCKKQLQILNKILDDFDINLPEEEEDTEKANLERLIYEKNIVNEKEYESFYKDAIINLIKKC